MNKCLFFIDEWRDLQSEAVCEKQKQKNCNSQGNSRNVSLNAYQIAKTLAR